jgi:REP element-mobilizing transposase RayT
LHVPGGVYYVVQRSNARQPIFTEEADYATFERLLSTMLVRCRVRAHAFCWETDAIHLVLQISDMPVGRLMQRLSSQYARRVHRRAGELGHLFQQRYHALLIDPEVYLLRLIRHVHMLPVRSGKVTDPADHPLSSHATYAGTANVPWLTTNVALRMLGQRPEQARFAYTRLMLETPASGETQSFEHGGTDDPRVLGDREFMAAIPRNMRVYRSTYSLDQVIDTVTCTLGLKDRSAFPVPTAAVGARPGVDHLVRDRTRRGDPRRGGPAPPARSLNTVCGGGTISDLAARVVQPDSVAGYGTAGETTAVAGEYASSS